MTRKPQIKFGLLGLGKVGRNVLLESQANAVNTGFRWVADSSRVISKPNHRQFTSEELSSIVRLKERSDLDLTGRYKTLLPNCAVQDFDSPENEISIIESLVGGSKRDWIILDTTASSASVGYRLASSFMGVLGYCTGNKEPWAHYDSCRRLFTTAIEKESYLGLNCTTGVWVDQMEVLPILSKEFAAGRLRISKRDNSSLNLFFSRIERGVSPEAALREIEETGHIEPGGRGLGGEINDQRLKAQISANFCGLLLNETPVFTDRTRKIVRDSESVASEIAEWHATEKGNGRYGALVTQIIIDAAKPIQCSLLFKGIPYQNSLATNLDGENAILVESPRAKFRWSVGGRDSRRGNRRSFFHTGRGGAQNTASKLLWESRRIRRLAERSCSFFHPLPILAALVEEQPEALALKNQLETCL